MPNKSPTQGKAKQNLTGVNGNDLQKLILLQHQVNHLENRINGVQKEARIEILPPSYSN